MKSKNSKPQFNTVSYLTINSILFTSVLRFANLASIIEATKWGNVKGRKKQIT